MTTLMVLDEYVKKHCHITVEKWKDKPGYVAILIQGYEDVGGYVLVPVSECDKFPFWEWSQAAARHLETL